MTMKAHRLLRIEQVMEMTALGRTTIYDRIRRGQFPEQRKLGRKCSRWSEAEIVAWIESQTR